MMFSDDGATNDEKVTDIPEVIDDAFETEDDEEEVEEVSALDEFGGDREDE
jgi:hypothetical protein